ncbi:MAG: hypothetical protein E6G35_06965 [Actinobacteria bacterium]|nr:MAG: hypothetical protein E6G35_06965 [Actinomycetota bacterium]
MNLMSPPSCRSGLVLRRGRLRVTYRSRVRSLVVLLVVLAAVSAGAALTGLLLAATVPAALLVAGWSVVTLRALRGIPVPRPGLGPPPPDSGVREPRRPLPFSPAGAAARPFPGAGDLSY